MNLDMLLTPVVCSSNSSFNIPILSEKNNSVWNTVKNSSSFNPILPKLVEVINDFIKTNDNLKMDSIYESLYIPPINIEKYIIRLCRYTSTLSPFIWIHMLIIMDNICAKKGIPITDKNAHRIILVAFLLAMKNYEDNYHSNSHIAKLGGITINELNYLEKETLGYLEWEFEVSLERYSEYYYRILNY